jgi:MYXO-CTERM domain-containing protein
VISCASDEARHIPPGPKRNEEEIRFVEESCEARLECGCGAVSGRGHRGATPTTYDIWTPLHGFAARFILDGAERLENIPITITVDNQTQTIYSAVTLGATETGQTVFAFGDVMLIAESSAFFGFDAAGKIELYRGLFPATVLLGQEPASAGSVAAHTPEPANLALGAIGMAALFLARRRTVH